MAAAKDHSESIAEALQHMHPELDAVREAGGDPVYLVGGAVRDLLLGRGRADIDLVIEGEAAALAERLGADVVSHERFATAKVRLDGHEVDVASARSESYPHPGALPAVEPGATLEEDLGRRDFTINAMAIALDGTARLIDPYGGQADLAAKQLRVLHPRSFADDPTRAIRAARYAARFGFELEPGTEKLLRKTDLDTVSAGRRDAELLRLAAEPSAPDAYRLLAEWGLIELREGGVELARRVGELLEEPLWQLRAERDRVVHAAATGEPGGELELAAADPSRPSEAVALVTAYGAVETVLARAHGAEWLDDYLEKWSQVELEIDGNDLIAAGVTEGVALGRGLAEAKRRKLDGEIEGREQELAVALEVARGNDAVA
ncbi:MAG: CCA tRNA nucleotidyltransferase [Chloroflexota bacterium]